MIKNSRQYATAKIEFKDIEGVLRGLRRTDGLYQTANERAQQLAAMLTDYEALCTGDRPPMSLANLQQLPQALIENRIALGLTQAQLGKRLGVVQQQIQKYEETEYRTASFDRILTVAEALTPQTGAELFNRALSYLNQAPEKFADPAVETGILNFWRARTNQEPGPGMRNAIAWSWGAELWRVHHDPKNFASFAEYAQHIDDMVKLVDGYKGAIRIFPEAIMLADEGRKQGLESVVFNIFGEKLSEFPPNQQELFLKSSDRTCWLYAALILSSQMPALRELLLTMDPSSNDAGQDKATSTDNLSERWFNYGKRGPLTEEKKGAIRRSATVDLQGTDIAYFLGVSYAVFQQFSKNEKIIREHKFKGGTAYVTPREASAIFEAHDRRISVAITYQLERPVITRRRINYALAHRQELEPKIVNALKVLYNDPTIATPY